MPLLLGCFAARIYLWVRSVLEGMVAGLSVVIILECLDFTVLNMRKSATMYILVYLVVNIVHFDRIAYVLVVETRRHRVFGSLHGQCCELAAFLICNEH
jgi:hypothetical protein